MDAHEESLWHDFIKVCVNRRVSGILVLQSTDDIDLPQRNGVLRELRGIGRSIGELHKLTGICERQLRTICNGTTNGANNEHSDSRGARHNRTDIHRHRNNSTLAGVRGA